MSFQDSKLKIIDFDAQASLQGAILVSVNGVITTTGSMQRRFSQVFLLAEQKPKGYYVYNDILRYFVAEPKSTESRANKLASPATLSDKFTQNSVLTQSKEVETETHSDHDSTNATVGTGSILEEPPALDNAETEKQEKPAPVIVNTTDDNKKSKKQHAAAEQAPATITTTSQPTSKPSKKEKQQQYANDNNPKTYAAIVGGDEYQPPAAPEKPASNNKDAKHSKSAKGTRVQHSLHITRLHPNATEDEIRSSLQGYGKILDISYTPVDGFAYVYFSTEEEVDRAVDARGAIFVHGVAVSVEKKKRSKPYNASNNNNSEFSETSRGGYRGRGRGGRGSFRGQRPFSNGKQSNRTYEQQE